MGVRGNPLKPAVFSDRDGTLNKPLVRDGHAFAPMTLDAFELFQDVPEACRAIKAAGYALVVATNQPDVGRGTLPQIEVEQTHARLLSLIPEIDLIEVCYDSGAGGDTRRRKPNPGMILDAAAALGLDLARSWMIGDRWRDIDCGRNAGVRTIFIDRGYSEALRAQPDFIVKSFGEAAATILSSLP